jgi:hypothetical protein
MPPLPTPEEWVQIRHEYENTRRSIEDICLAYGTSANTLRRRVKAWGWTMRRPPISDEGPEAVAGLPLPPAGEGWGEGNFKHRSLLNDLPSPDRPRCARTINLSCIARRRRA